MCLWKDIYSSIDCLSLYVAISKTTDRQSETEWPDVDSGPDYSAAAIAYAYLHSRVLVLDHYIADIDRR